MLKSHLKQALGWLCVLIFGALTLVVLWQVVSRYLLDSPSSSSEELARIFLMWLGLLGASYAHLENNHIAIRVFPDLAPEARDQAIILVCQVFAVILLVGGAKLCHATYLLQQTTPVLGWSQAVVYSVLPLSGLLLSVGNYFHLTSEGPE